MRNLIEEDTKEEEVKSDNKNKLFAIFAITFIIVFVLIFKVAQMLSPSVDVEIGNEDEAEQTDKDESVRNMIDERLKWIQFEDNTVTQDNSQIEYQVIDDHEDIIQNTKSGDDHSVIQHTDNAKDTAKPEAPEVGIKNLPPAASVGNNAAGNSVAPKMSKVYIGRYSTIEQAMVVQNEILNSDLNITPNIQGINGKFVLQAGVFANSANAAALAERLSQYGYNAEIVQE